MSHQIYAYALISKNNCCLETQLTELKKYSYDQIVIDEVTKIKAKKPEFIKLKSKLSKGDTLLIYRLDRIADSLKNLIKILNELNDLHVNLVSISDKIDTRLNCGYSLFHITDAFSKFDNNLTQSHASNALSPSSTRRKKSGRKKGFTKNVKIRCTTIYQEYKKKEKPIDVLCKEHNIAKSTFYRFRSEQLKKPETQYDIFEKRV